jgi:hypothetical protein
MAEEALSHGSPDAPDKPVALANFTFVLTPGRYGPYQAEIYPAIPERADAGLW